MTHARNLCATVENRARFETLRCTVGNAINPYANGGRSWAFNHRWPNRDGGLGGGNCLNCGLPLKQLRMRINPRSGEPLRKSTLAREIAAGADTAPVRFTGAMP